jgi:hypothetical protein
MVILFFLVATCGTVLTWQLAHLRGTTLVAPAMWCLAALAALLLAGIMVEDVPAIRSGGWSQGWLLFAGSATLCPGMALLGAKRPQDAAWQMIVLALWLVLSLPAVAAMLGLGGGQIGWHPAQAWFLVVLLLVQATNYVGTRYALPVAVATAGQYALLYLFLPWSAGALPPTWTPRQLMLLALSLMSLALLGGVAIAHRRRTRMANHPIGQLEPIDRLWLDFRDAFGVVWALRLMQRINQSAVRQNWTVRLEWRGFIANSTTPQHGDNGGNPPESDKTQLPHEKVLAAHFQNVLRRFVSPQWIAERLAGTVN